MVGFRSEQFGSLVAECFGAVWALVDVFPIVLARVVVAESVVVECVATPYHLWRWFDCVGGAGVIRLLVGVLLP